MQESAGVNYGQQTIMGVGAPMVEAMLKELGHAEKMEVFEAIMSPTFEMFLRVLRERMFQVFISSNAQESVGNDKFLHDLRVQTFTVASFLEALANHSQLARAPEGHPFLLESTQQGDELTDGLVAE